MLEKGGMWTGSWSSVLAEMLREGELGCRGRNVSTHSNLVDKFDRYPELSNVLPK